MAKNNKAKCILAVMLAAVVTISNGTVTVAFAAEGAPELSLASEETVITGQCGDNAEWTLDLTTGTLTISGTGAMADSVSERPWEAYLTDIKTVDIHEGITAIGRNAFYNCSELESAVLPVGLQTLGALSFYGCSSLTEIEIPAGVTSIGESAFNDCKELTSITIPSSVTSIGTQAFLFCEKLTSVVLPSGLKTLGQQAFSNCISLTEIEIPAGVTTIGGLVFDGCTGLESVTISEGVTSINSFAFRGCTKLQSLEIPSTVASIGNRAFYGVAVQSLVLPENVSIDQYAFSACRDLETIIMIGETPAYTHEKAFQFSGTDGNTANIKLCVPSSFVEDYKKTAPWSAMNVQIVDRVLDYATAEITDQRVTGSQIKPAITVKDALGNVIDASCYTITYGENTLVGLGSVVITAAEGSGYTGTLEKVFLINPDLSGIETLTLDTVTSADQVAIEAVLEMLRNANTNGVDEATLAEWNSIEGNCNALLAKIQEVAAENKGLIDAVDSYDADSVKSSDKEALEQLVEDIGTQLGTDNLTDEEKAALEEAKKDAEALLEKIEDVLNDIVTDSVVDAGEIVEGAVKPEDKETLENAKADLEQALQNNKDHYTEEEKQIIQDEIQRLEDMITSIEKVEQVEDVISKLPGTTEPDDETVIRDIMDAKNVYDSLTEHEKSLLDASLREKLDDLLAAMVAYEFEEGNGESWEQNSNGDLTFVVNGAFSKFTGIEVDGKAVSADCYDAEAGSTVITLDAEYLQTLTPGKHTITVMYTDGAVTGTFTVLATAGEKPDVPATGDSRNFLTLTALMASSAAAAGIVLVNLSVIRKRRTSGR